jgi:hypothetical protein
MSAAPELEAAPEACPNCGSARGGRYCSTCGQKAEPIAPTLRYFLQELMQEVVNVDGKIFRSLRYLLTRPGFLTREIFAGRRANYVSPIRLYLAMSILAFAIAPFGTFSDNARFEFRPSEGETINPVQAEQVAEGQRVLDNSLEVWLPRAMFVLVPVFAAFVMLFRRRSGYTYPQHLYFALHAHAVFFFASAVDSTFEALDPGNHVAPFVDKAMGVFFLGSFVIAFWRVYETTIWGTLWRTVSIALLYGLVVALTVIAIMAPIFFAIMQGQFS